MGYIGMESRARNTAGLPRSKQAARHCSKAIKSRVQQLTTISPSRIYVLVALVLVVLWQLTKSAVFAVSQRSSHLLSSPLRTSPLRTSPLLSSDGSSSQLLRTLAGRKESKAVLGPLLASVLEDARRVRVLEPLDELVASPDLCRRTPPMEVTQRFMTRHTGETSFNFSSSDIVRWGEKEEGYRHLIVVSTGGVGSTYIQTRLHNALSEYKWKVNLHRIPSLQNFWKHHYPGAADLHVKQMVCWGADRVVYLFNDPVAQLQSLYRRGFIDAVKYFASWNGLKGGPEAFESLDSYVRAVMEHRRDLGGFHQHMMAWLHGGTACPALFATTKTFLKNMPTVAKFLAVPPDAVSSLQWLPRNSSGLESDSTFPARFLDFYAEVYEYMKLADMTITLPEDYVDPPDLRSERARDGPPVQNWHCRDGAC